VTTGEGKTRILSYPDLEPVLHLNYKGQPRTEFMLHGHTSSCLTTELQPTGRYLATGGSDSIIALWDTTDWICQRTITNMVGPVRSISENFTHPPLLRACWFVTRPTDRIFRLHL